MQLASIFNAKIVDVAHDSVIIEIAATEQKVDSLVELCKPFGIIEMVRTGRVAMARGFISNGNANGAVSVTADEMEREEIEQE